MLIIRSVMHVLMDVSVAVMFYEDAIAAHPTRLRSYPQTSPKSDQTADVDGGILHYLKSIKHPIQTALRRKWAVIKIHHGTLMGISRSMSVQVWEQVTIAISR
jgi:hypothetical protein